MVPLSDIEPLPAELPLWTGATQQPSVKTGNLRLLPITSMGLESYETTRSKQSILHLLVPTKGLQKNPHALILTLVVGFYLKVKRTYNISRSKDPVWSGTISVKRLDVRLNKSLSNQLRSSYLSNLEYQEIRDIILWVAIPGDFLVWRHTANPSIPWKFCQLGKL